MQTHRHRDHSWRRKLWHQLSRRHRRCRQSARRRASSWRRRGCCFRLLRRRRDLLLRQRQPNIRLLEHNPSRRVEKDGEGTYSLVNGGVHATTQTHIRNRTLRAVACLRILSREVNSCDDAGKRSLLLSSVHRKHEEDERGLQSH